VLSQSVLWDCQDRGDKYDKLEKEVKELGGVKVDVAVVSTRLNTALQQVDSVRTEGTENRAELARQIDKVKDGAHCSHST